ncbi:hypothetical protein CFM99_26290, partial [Klebsiella pneumoniae]|nr:hypothetical protein [Klebsiella pneumoniae]
ERRKNTTASSTMALQAHRIRFSVVGKGIMVIVGFLRVKKRAVRGRLREGAESYAKALASDILR